MSQELLLHAMELLAPLGSVKSRRMFGGFGLDIDGLFVAIIAFEQLYLKADAQTRHAFESAGCQVFEYQREGKPIRLSYFRAPEEAMESPALMRPWGQLALAAALRAGPRKVRRPQGAKHLILPSATPH